MAEPLSIAASVVGIVVPALHATRLLLDDIQNLKEAPSTVLRLAEEARSVEAALTALKAVDDSEWEKLGAVVAEETKKTISVCTEACAKFRASFRRWTRTSDKKLAFTDRAKIGFFKQTQVKVVAEHLQNCKSSITSVVSMATLYSSIRHTIITEEVKETMVTKQTEIEDAVKAAGEQLAALNDKFEELHVSDKDQDETASSADKHELLQLLENERKALESSRRLLEKLLSTSQKQAAVMAVSFGDSNTGLQAGVIHGGVSGLVFGR